MEQGSFVDFIREESSAKNLAQVMKDVVSAIAAPAETRATLRQKIDDLCGDKKLTEHARQVDEFSFTKPERTLDEWLLEIRRKQIEPVKDIHYKIEYGVNYANGNQESWTLNEEAEAWKAADSYKENFEKEEDRRQTAQALEGQDRPERKILTREEITLVYDETKRQTRINNRQARLRPPRWEILARSQNNDSSYEDKELRFKEKDEKFKKDDTRDTDWVKNIGNIKRLGEQLGYTERHYKTVLDRFISWFSPELSGITEKLSANATARFLMKLNMPDTEQEKIQKQLDRLSRKPGGNLRSVMAYLFEIATAINADKQGTEKTHNIRYLMVTGLIRFTHGRLREELVGAARWASNRRTHLDWKALMEKAIEKEVVYGMPPTELIFKSTDDVNNALQRMYNVNYGLKYSPNYAPKYIPGQGEYPDRHQLEQDPHPIIQDDYSDFGSGYPSAAELARELEHPRLKTPARTPSMTSEKQTPESPPYDTPYRNLESPQLRQADVTLTDTMDDLSHRLAHSFHDETPHRQRTQSLYADPKRHSSREKRPVDRLGVNTTQTAPPHDKNIRPQQTTGTARETDRNKSQNDQRQNRDRPRNYSNDRNRQNRSNDRNPRNSDRNPRSNDRNSRSNDRNPRNNDRNSRSNDRNYRSSDRDARSNERNSRQYRSNDRNPDNNRNGRNTSQDRNRSQTRQNNERQGRSRDRNDRQNQNARDRNSQNNTRDRRQSQTRTNYSSNDRSQGRNYSNSRGQDQGRARSYDRNRSNSRNDRTYRNSSEDRIRYNRGITYSDTYDNRKIRSCDKCGKTDHHPYNCPTYDRYSRFACKTCDRNLHHWSNECAEQSRRQDRGRPDSRNRNNDQYSRPRSNSRSNFKYDTRVNNSSNNEKN